MKRLFLLAGLVCVLPFTASAQLFAPGNIIFADPYYTPDGQICELKVHDDDTAEIINVVRWDLGGFGRRRALGLDVDPNGNVWVGITGTGDLVEDHPLGLGEVLRIEADGTQTFFETDTIKVTHLAAIGANKVIINSNATDNNDQNLAQLVDVTSGQAVLTNFNKSGHGEALLLPDGRLLMGDSGNSGIIEYSLSGGDPIGKYFDDGRTVRALAYNDDIGAVIALLQDQHTLLRVSLDGQLEEEYDAGIDGFGTLWGIAQVPGTTDVIMGNHNVTDSFNEFVIYNATDFLSEPRFIEITAGFEEVGLAADFQFRSFFNMAVVPEFTSVDAWDLH